MLKRNNIKCTNHQSSKHRKTSLQKIVFEDDASVFQGYHAKILSLRKQNVTGQYYKSILENL